MGYTAGLSPFTANFQVLGRMVCHVRRIRDNQLYSHPLCQEFVRNTGLVSRVGGRAVSRP